MTEKREIDSVAFFNYIKISRLLDSRAYKLQDDRLGKGIGFDVKSGESVGKLEFYPFSSTVRFLSADATIELSGMEKTGFTKDEEITFQSTKKGRERYFVLGKTGEITLLYGRQDIHGGNYGEESGKPSPLLSPSRRFPSVSVTRLLS